MKTNKTYKTRKAPVKDRVLSLLKTHGKNLTYLKAASLYLQAYSRRLNSKSFYQIRKRYKHSLLPKAQPSKAVPTCKSVQEPNFLAAAEIEAKTPAPVDVTVDTYSYHNLRKVKDLAKEVGGLQCLQEAVVALQDLQE